MGPVTHDKYPELNELSYRTEWEALHSLSKLSHRTSGARQVLHKLSELSYRTEWQILDRAIFWGFSTYSFTCPRSDLWEWEHSSSRERSEEECKRTPGYILHNHPGSVWVYIHVDMQSCLQTTFFAPARKMGLVNCLFRFCSSVLQSWRTNLTLDITEVYIPHCVPTLCWECECWMGDSSSLA